MKVADVCHRLPALVALGWAGSGPEDLASLVATVALIGFERPTTHGLGILGSSAPAIHQPGVVAVGEVIAEVDAEEAPAGLPVLLCLAQARTMVDDIDRLNLLAGHDAAVVLSDPDDWHALAATVDLVGRWDAATAALSALDLDVPVLTGTPGLYAGLGGGDLTIGV